MNTSTGKESWLGFGLGGMLLYSLPSVQPDQYTITLIAGCALAVLAGIQRTLVKYIELSFTNKSDPLISVLKQAEDIEQEVRNGSN